jgi:AraC-like DNA-binding protein
MGAKVDWATLAQELGYHDQSHLIRDFDDQVGLTPGARPLGAPRCAGALRAGLEGNAGWGTPGASPSGCGAVGARFACILLEAAWARVSLGQSDR